MQMEIEIIKCFKSLLNNRVSQKAKNSILDNVSYANVQQLVIVGCSRSSDESTMHIQLHAISTITTDSNQEIGLRGPCIYVLL